MTQAQIDEIAQRLWAERWQMPWQAWRHLPDEQERQQERQRVAEVIAALREAGFEVVDAEDGR